MRRADTIQGYAAIRSAEYRIVATAEAYVVWAQDMLEAGLESPSVLRLAIAEPPYFTPDLQRVFESAVDELGIEPLHGEPALILHAQQIAAQLLAGTIPPLAAGSAIGQIFTPELGPAGLDHWSLIDEANWCEYCRASFAGEGTMEEAIVEEAKKLLSIDWRAG